ncbi:MAG: TrkA C-terminal domain-containing protein [Nocardioides sp.]
MSVAVCALWWRLPARKQVFMSWAGLRGAVPIVLATIPIAQDLTTAREIFDVVFLLVVGFTLVQAPMLPWLARRTGVAVDTSTRDLDVESAPLEEIDAHLLQLRVPPGSGLAGTYVVDLRLPGNAALALVHRGGHLFVPDEHTSLEADDHLLLAVPGDVRAATERRLRAIGRTGRLATWYEGVPKDPGLSAAVPIAPAAQVGEEVAAGVRSARSWVRVPARPRA